MSNLEVVLKQRPIVVALAGPNGAGKSTFYEAELSRTGLLFINADVIAAATGVDAYTAADMAEAYRQKLIAQRASFIFETVFSDPVGDKLGKLLELENSGYTVILIYIGVASPDQSASRVGMRVAQGGHDVPPDKVADRYERTLKNLSRALVQMNYVFVYDHSDLIQGYRLVVSKLKSELTINEPLPEWLKRYLPDMGRHIN